MKKNCFKTLLIFLFVSSTSLLSFSVADADDKSQDYARIKIGYNGTSLTIINTADIQPVHVRAIDIFLCDGTEYRVWSWRGEGIQGLWFSIGTDNPLKLYFSPDNPMRRATVTFGDHTPKTVTRHCDELEELPKLYCNPLMTPLETGFSYSSSYAAIPFVSNKYVYSAELALPGQEYRVPLILNSFDAESRTWKAGLTTMFLTYRSARGTSVGNLSTAVVGSYPYATLIIQDEFGQQAKCRTGPIEIRP